MTEKEKERTETGTETGEEIRANRTETAVKRDEKGRFVKGTSGNPTGRPTMPFSVRQTLIDMLPKALETVQSIINDENAKDDVRLRASELVIDRNLGKAVTPVLTDTVGKDSPLTLSEMIACAKELLES